MGKIFCGLLMPAMNFRRNAILDWMAMVGRPVLFSEMQATLGISFADAAFEGLRRDGVVAAVFPESRPGDSGRQFWDFANWTAVAA